MFRLSSLTFLLVFSVFCHAYPYSSGIDLPDPEEIPIYPPIAKPRNSMWPRPPYIWPFVPLKRISSSIVPETPLPSNDGPPCNYPKEMIPDPMPAPKPPHSGAPFDRNPPMCVLPGQGVTVPPSFPNDRPSIWSGPSVEMPQPRGVFPMPWMMTLTIHKPDADPGSCGGALIALDLVLTSAECLEGAEAVDAVFDRDPDHHFWSSRFIYTTNQEGSAAGVGLIKLPQLVVSNEAQPIALAKNSVPAEVVVYLESTLNRRLKMHMLEDSACGKEDVWGGGKGCAVSYGGGGVCGVRKGDSVVSYEFLTPLLVGVVSQEVNSRCKGGSTVTFAKLSVYADWIDANYRM